MSIEFIDLEAGAFVRFLYTFLLYLALPAIFWRLWRRSRQLPAYKERISERMGYYPFKLHDCIWVHTVSVGETVAAIPLIRALKAKFPGTPILVTTMTPTGAQKVRAAFDKEVKHAYLPYDFPGAMKRFFQAFRPKIGIIVETELWPNLLAVSRAQNVPMCLLNARLSEKSARGYGRIKSLTREMLSTFAAIGAASEADASRLIALGAPSARVTVTGNIKFDMEAPADLIDKSKILRETIGNQRPVWVAASTHAGEEEQVLKAHALLRKTFPNALLILVPRHPDRFEEVAAQVLRSQSIQRRSSKQFVDSETSVYLGDTMGELLLFYGVADAAFVGGSLVATGGHNVLEPAFLGKAILTGPHLFNFTEISGKFIAANAMTIVKNPEELADALTRLFKDPAFMQAQGLQAKAVIDANHGAAKKQLDLILGVLSQRNIM